MLNKPKLAYVGASHHLERTKSASFLVDLLAQSYDIEFFITDSWGDNPEISLLPVHKEYSVIVFFQTVPSCVASLLLGKNMVFCPMFDQCGADKIDEWMRYKNFKILCFSRFLYKKLNFYGFSCLSVQYFPETISYKSEQITSSLFLWPRRPELQWSVIKKLFPEGFFKKIHIHLATDWGKVELPSDIERTGLKLSTSEWFSTNDEYLKLIEGNSFFVAPRLAEGIGFSFLEAMARGRIVIAANKPTMNEYICNGKTGFLFNPKRPRRVRLVNLPQMQINLRNYMNAGRTKWLSDREKIFHFIDESTKLSTKSFVIAYIMSALIMFVRKIKQKIKAS